MFTTLSVHYDLLAAVNHKREDLDISLDVAVARAIRDGINADVNLRDPLPYKGRLVHPRVYVDGDLWHRLSDIAYHQGYTLAHVLRHYLHAFVS